MGTCVMAPLGYETKPWGHAVWLNWGMKQGHGDTRYASSGADGNMREAHDGAYLVSISEIVIGPPPRFSYRETTE